MISNVGCIVGCSNENPASIEIMESYFGIGNLEEWYKNVNEVRNKAFSDTGILLIREGE